MNYFAYLFIHTNKMHFLSELQILSQVNEFNIVFHP